MKVAFDGSILLSPAWTGVEKQFVLTLEALLRIEPSLEAVVAVPEGKTVSLPPPAQQRALPKCGGRAFWRDRLLAPWLRQEGFDLLHSPVAALPLAAPCPTVATVHELPWREGGTEGDEGRSWRHRLRLRATAETATLVIVPSAHTAKRLCQEAPRLERRVRVVPGAVDFRFFAVTAQEIERAASFAGAEPGGYLLALGATRVRKNLPFLLRAHERARALSADVPPLRVFGPPASYVPEDLLPGLVAGARALLYPSLSEGFGAPPLEAMAAGVPVLASDRGAIPEVVGDAALLAPPDDEERFARALLRIAGDEELRAALARRGKERARTFTPERVARAWTAVHGELARCG